MSQLPSLDKGLVFIPMGEVKKRLRFKSGQDHFQIKQNYRVLLLIYMVMTSNPKTNYLRIFELFIPNEYGAAWRYKKCLSNANHTLEISTICYQNWNGV